MAELFTIGELATAFALSPRAIRFYEDQGLLAPERAGTQRVYTKRDRARLQLILRGKRLGFSLADIREFLDLYDADSTKRQQMAMTLGRTRARIAELEQQLEDITVTLAELRDMEGDIVAYMAAHPQAKPTDIREPKTLDKRTA
jgi:DNA-binding transcriptional MerR regulator